VKVGMAVIFQNPGDARPDRDVYLDELRLADLAEPLGFDSIWSVEHHFTDYTMVPDVLQLLSYLAGRTQRVQLGSMVVVLPWHDPLRVAEQVALLDNLSGGRMLFGIGRGAGRVEFEGFRVSMSESRERFVESAEMILRGLEKGFCESSGKFVQQTRKPLRPAPFRSFRGRTYAAAVSPESVRIMAELGVGILIIPQKPWETTAAELAEYRTLYRQLNGDTAPPTIAAGWTFCDPDESRAREQAERWIGTYWRTVLRHYELGGGHFAREKGYEFYGRMSDAVARHGPEGVTDFFLNLQVWGTPEQCFHKVKEIRARVGCDTFVGVFSYAGMPAGEAERNARLFAKEVMPELQRLALE
jgi:alkanesulfonate monooxygenase SsuD/methylene tetrahydromethanopterin reductase-like flavin-dependent oxidoreductase (luciferase family)